MTDRNAPDNNAELPRATDFAALDPTRDASRFGATIQAIAAEAMAARRQARMQPRSALAPVVAWGRMTIAAAAVVLIVAGSALVVVPAPASAAAPESLAESAGIPAGLVAIAANTRRLTAEELVAAFDTMAVASHGTPRTR